MEKPFPWQWDNERGYVLGVTTNIGKLILSKYDTEIYTFPNQPEVSHVFRFLEQDENENRGAFIWRHCLPDFDRLIREMAFRDFPVVYGEPSDGDYRAFMAEELVDLNSFTTVPEEWE